MERKHRVSSQKNFSEITWQTSDPKSSNRLTLREWISYEELNLIMPNPISKNLQKRAWKILTEILTALKFIILINVIHVTSWNYKISLFIESQHLMRKNHNLMI